MTEYFEVLERDAAARIGELRLESPVTTPGLVDEVIQDAGSLWTEDRAVPDGDRTTLTVLPHRAIPRGSPPEVAEAFEPAPPVVDYPAAVVVSPGSVSATEADAYVLAGAASYLGHGEALVDAILPVREAIPADTALYAPAAATPATLPLLAYLGVDLVDEDRAVLKGRQGQYLTTEGAAPLSDLQEYPCPCPVCESDPDEFSRTDCVTHNRQLLHATLRQVRNRIRSGRLREYIEGQVRHEPWLTAALRHVDIEWGYLEERTPLYRRAEIDATTEDALHRVEVKRFADRVTTRYRPRFDDRPLLLVPCSARKPYGQSRSHGRFQDAAQYRAHLVSLSSPVGVVPRELELTYPAQHYDAAVTGRWSAGEIQFVSTVLERYVDRADYPRVVAHVPDDGYREVCERVFEDRSIEVTYTVVDHPTDDESLSRLRDALAAEDTIPVADHERATVRAIADYQFGDGAGDGLFGDWTLSGRHPKLRVERDGEQLAALVPQYGLLALTIAGAQRWRDGPVPTRVVEIDDFVPQGSVLAPGVVESDAEIRPGDEVLVSGPSAVAVGRAVCHGRAMEESTRGVVVDVRHVHER